MGKVGIVILQLEFLDVEYGINARNLPGDTSQDQVKKALDVAWQRLARKKLCVNKTVNAGFFGRCRGNKEIVETRTRETVVLLRFSRLL